MNSAQPDYESVMEMGGLVWTTGFHQRWATSRLISNCSIRQARAQRRPRARHARGPAPHREQLHEHSLRGEGSSARRYDG